MAKTYTVTPKQGLQETLCRARDLAASKGWSLKGDDGAGEFSGSGVKGSYLARGGELTIIVTHKPFLASWNDIAKGIAKLFS